MKKIAITFALIFGIAMNAIHAQGNVVTLTSETGEVALYDGDVLTGTGGTETHVMIAYGATVTLSDVNITAPNHSWPGITGTSNATIILVGTNAVQGGNECSGIWVPSGYTLTIQGDGSLTATGGGRGAGIGSGYGNDNNCGDIVIEDGTITATGGSCAAGIGGSYSSCCGNITIVGGNVTAIGGYHSAGIGTGEYLSSCGNITITPDVTALTVTGSYADAIGNGYFNSCSSGTITIGGVVTGRIPQTPFNYNPLDTTPYIVTFDANGHQGTMASETFTANTPRALPACTFTYDDYHVFTGWNTAANGSGYSFADEQAIINLGEATLYAQWMPIAYSITYTNAQDGMNSVTNTNPQTYTYDSDDITLTDPLRPGYNFDGWTFEGQDTPTKTVIIPHGSSGDKSFTAHWSFSTTAAITTTAGEVMLVDGQTLTGTGGKKTQVTIAAGATVTFSGVDITSIGMSSGGYINSPYQWAGITCLGDATIILSGENAVKGGYHSAGIFIPAGNTLTIQGDGSLNATGEKYGAGIGSGYNESCGNIIIEGGIVVATGGENAVGIGSGQNGSGGNIVINGGTITATGGEYAAGIGSGKNDSCGNILISGGTITATGGEKGPGIGSGQYGSCGNIDISGGTITVIGGKNAAGIGCGDGKSTSNSTCGDITIARTVTSVTVTKGRYAQNSIGGCDDYSVCGTVTIGGVIGAIADSPYTYTPSGSMTSTVHFDANGGSGEMADWLFTCDGAAHAIPVCTFTAPDGMLYTKWNTATDGSGVSFIAGQQIYDIGDMTLYAMWRPLTESVPNGALTLYDGQTLTGTGGSKTHVTIVNGATVTLSGVKITSITYQWAGITCLGDATIILSGENAVKGGDSSAGIFVPAGKTLTIQGDGSLNTTGKTHGAGLGSGEIEECGNIVINGGTITATGGSSGAGIGSGNDGSCGDITITGGTITATGASSSAGIGSGNGGSCGDITITGGTITATAGTSSAAIGCGNNSSDDPSSCGNITIANGVTCVIATKKSTSNKVNIIGTSGTYSTCGTITIEPSLIDALSNEDMTRSIYHGLVLFDDADNAIAITANADGTTHDAQLRNYTLHRDGDWNTLTVPFTLGDATADDGHHFDGTPLEGATVKALSSSAFSNGTLTLNFEDAASIEAGKPYIVKWNDGLNLIINSTNDWNAFAEAVNGGKSYAGKTVRLRADIDVSTMVGTAEHPFSGTFEGKGYTLNVSISSDDDGAAPFRYVSGATIRNVKTMGTVSGGDHSAGLVGMALGGTNHIRDCYVSASVSGGSYAGGILGNGTTSTTTISNSLFDGSLTAYNMGILYGWGEDGGTHTVENCVALGTYADVSGGEGGSIDLLLGNGTKTVTNCMKGTEVGSQGVYMVVVYFGGGEHPLVTDFLGSQWTFDNGFLLNPTVNILDTNIENPVFSNVLVSTATANVSTTYADFIGSYAPITDDSLLLDAHNPDGDAMHAALSINEPAHEGYTFNGWYTDAALTTPVTTIPFAADGTVTLYAKSSINRAITGHNGNNDGGWAFIASPVSGSIAPAAVSNLVAETAENYDFYRFNQSNTNGKEWENFKATTTENHPDFTGLVNGRGYLYANYDNVTLSFTGTFNTEATQVVPLDYDANAEMAGWNLVGNPFPVAATISNAQGDLQPFYVISGRNVVATQGSSVIEPCTGVMVKANDTGESVTFTRANAQSQAPQPNGLQIALTQPTANTRGTSNAQVDNAIVSFNEGESLEKFVFNANLAKLYIPQGNKDFAIAYAEKEGEKPLNFKAVENGGYTLSVNADGVEMDYLHLIDNLTGADVDLLAMPSYSFEAKTSDYASRFRLVFKAHENDLDNTDNFAFVSNGEIIVNGEGYLQVFDVLGHQLFAKQLSTLNSQLSILTAPGVYVLRLIDGEKVRTQKMVIDGFGR